MRITRIKRPSASMVVAMVALFVGLGGTAGAVATQAVPLAKRALVADRAKVANTAKVADKAKTANTAKVAQTAQNTQKLGGQTSAQIVQQASQAAGPASTAAGIVSTKTQSAQLGPGGSGPFTLSCDTGQKVLSGGFISDNAVLIVVGNGPISETQWGIGLLNADESAPANVNLYAICIS